MTYDKDLAHRIRELLADAGPFTEAQMFGGLKFAFGGHMAFAASHGGGMIVRFDPALTDEIRAEPHTDPFVMRGREMNGWIRITPEGVETLAQLRPWVERGVAYARSLPPKGTA